MPSKVTTTQGQAWDQIALDRLGSEKQMDALLPRNVEEMDVLLLAGERRITVPDVQPKAVRSLPPWERM